ncbi:rhomboid family intramembrane serine protease [Nesterenkonia alba]|uniref:rhomboid family intramembrane serine protease n=1 Tax=Nesterenkonia alba TaxID=515814 RepID=UPI0003B4B4A2|nr:rhomboid family intramembrane serine protease [Nesterenkonia alba]
MSAFLQPPESPNDDWRSISGDLKRTFWRTFLPVVIPLAAMWLVFILNGLTGNWLNVNFGLRPRSLDGLSGVLFMPLLHGGLVHTLSFSHIVGNTFSWLVLGGMVSLLTRRFPSIMVMIWLLSGLILWIIGTPWTLRPDGTAGGLHIGASGVIYGFAAFLVVYGILSRRLLAIVFAVFVTFFYGLSMLFGMLPVGNSGVSWTGHLSGAVAGVVVALFHTGRLGRRRRTDPANT